MENLVLVHGAGSGPWVFDGWAGNLSGFTLHTVDLHEDLDVASASMTDYRDRVVAAMKAIGAPVALCGWSMGGLVALMATQELVPSALVLIEPSPPGEVQGFHPESPLERGTFDPEDVYGRFPASVASRPESSLARGERKQGISVPEVPCPTLVISGDEFRSDRGDPVASFYEAEHRYFEDLDHWGLLTSSEVRAAIGDWLSRV